MKLILKYIGVILVVYCAIGFIKCEYNATLWTEDLRYAMVCVVGIGIFLVFLKEEQDK